MKNILMPPVAGSNAAALAAGSVLFAALPIVMGADNYTVAKGCVLAAAAVCSAFFIADTEFGKKDCVETIVSIPNQVYRSLYNASEYSKTSCEKSR